MVRSLSAARERRKATTPYAGFPAFVIVWCGQFASLTGSALSAFALAVYIYQLTGSVTALAMVYALAFLPLIGASAFTGSLVDRWGVRRSMLVGNAGSLLVMLTLAGLLFTDTFAAWHIYVIVTANSVLRALHMPAFAASIPLLVPKRQIGRANGMRMVALATSQVLAPAAAGGLLMAIDVSGLILLDYVSYGLAILTLLVVRIPLAHGTEKSTGRGLPALLRDFGQAWRYVVARPGLRALLLLIAALNFGAGFVDVLITPLVLAFASSQALGVALSVGGIGMIIASVAMSVWGGPRRRVRAILWSSLVLAAATVIGSVRPSVPLVAVAAFVFMGALAVIISTNQSIWQTKVEPRLLGRTMAMQNMVANAPQLLSYVLAGPAADAVFEPLVGRDRVRAPLLALIVGDGPGRGIALLFMLVGGFIGLCVAVAASSARLRRLEDDLPDAVGDEETVGEEPAVHQPALKASSSSDGAAMNP